MENEELKPCPFCGGEADLSQEDKPQVWFVFCKKCGVSTDTSYEESQAVGEWNTRPSPWIPITPETLPEVEDYPHNNSGASKTVLGKGAKKTLFLTMYCHNRHSWIVGDAVITHYMPIPPLPERK
jgi:Lar family restriction alleviation protein